MHHDYMQSFHASDVRTLLCIMICNRSVNHFKATYSNGRRRTTTVCEWCAWPHSSSVVQGGRHSEDDGTHQAGDLGLVARPTSGTLTSVQELAHR